MGVIGQETQRGTAQAINSQRVIPSGTATRRPRMNQVQPMAVVLAPVQSWT